MLSITIPLFNEAENIPALYERLVRELEALARPFEIILVNDGSGDDSERILDALAAKDPRVKVVHFRRNFGFLYTRPHHFERPVEQLGSYPHRLADQLHLIIILHHARTFHHRGRIPQSHARGKQIGESLLFCHGQMLSFNPDCPFPLAASS